MNFVFFVYILKQKQKILRIYEKNFVDFENFLFKKKK